MPKQTTTFPLALPQAQQGQPWQRWLYEVLRAEILAGRLHTGARLPATRDLAKQYRLARGTVVAAFDQLRSEGYLEAKVGSGTYVSKILPDELLHVRGGRNDRSGGPRRQRHLSEYARRVVPFPVYEVPKTRAFRANQPALDLFPAALWTQVTARRLRRMSTQMLLGCGPLGYRPLRDAVADYLNASRGVKCTAEQVVIVSGVQEALDLVTRLLLDPGDRVCMESPGYVGASIVFKGAGAKVGWVRVDEEGLDVREAKRQWRHARLIYVTPAHQFPLGVTMSLGRRLGLLEWAQQAGALIFEDDYDSEFRYSGRPVPALQGLDRTGSVLFAGSFSKVMFPSLRLGYLVVPQDLVDRFAAIKSVSSRHQPVLEQAILCDFIAEGHFARHIRRMRAVYGERLAVLSECARTRLGGLLEIPGVEAGLQTVGWLKSGIHGEAAAEAAAVRNVEVIPIGRYTPGPCASREGLQLGFAAVDTREIRRGVEELGVALEQRRLR